ncbi:MAG: hypothetical protein OXD46_10510 [Chloroflexi bacterium]|nr:hypothetical protein [Chloroflexota bacterium]
MTPTLTKTSETACVLTFPSDDRCGETAYAIEYDAFYANWNVSPHLPSALLGTGRSLTDIVDQLIYHEGVRRDNLARAAIDLQIVTAQAYLRNEATQ